MLRAITIIMTVCLGGQLWGEDKNPTITHEKYVLDNGLTVLLSEDHSAPFVATSVWYKVGGVNERPKKTGLAHLFEHLMFEGSAHVKQDDHFKLLEGVGAFQVNASTSFDRTNYFETVPKSQLELSLALESSRMFWLNISQAKLDEQRAVVRREREQRYETSPYGLATLSLWQSIFPEANPMHGRVIGSHEDLEQASLSDVQSFYDQFYGPTNASIALVGDFTSSEVKKLINQYFASLPNSGLQAKPSIAAPVLTEQEILRYQEKLGRLPMIRIQYLTPAVFKPGDADLDVIAHILTGGEHGRLTKAITREQPLTSSVAAYQQSFGQVSVFTIDAMLNPGVDDVAVIKEIDKVIAGLSIEPPSALEIERARNAILTNYYFNLQDLGGDGGKAEALQSYQLFTGDSNFMEKDLARYQAVNSQSIAESSVKYLPAERARKILIASPLISNVANKDR